MLMHTKDQGFIEISFIRTYMGAALDQADLALLDHAHAKRGSLPAGYFAPVPGQPNRLAFHLSDHGLNLAQDNGKSAYALLADIIADVFGPQDPSGGFTLPDGSYYMVEHDGMIWRKYNDPDHTNEAVDPCLDYDFAVGMPFFAC